MKNKTLYLIRVFLVKEIQLFLSSKNIFWQAAIFSISIFFIFQFSIKNIPYSLINPQESTNQSGLQSYIISHIYTYVGVFWIIHTITSLFILLNSFYWEYEGGAFYLLKSANLSPEIFFLSKGLILTLVLTIIFLIEVLLWYFSIFYPIRHIFSNNMHTANIILYISILGLLSSLSISVIGMVSSIIALNTKYPFIFIALILLPLSFPCIVLSAKYTRDIINHSAELSIQNFSTLAGFFFIYLAVFAIIYEYLWSED